MPDIKKIPSAMRDSYPLEEVEVLQLQVLELRRDNAKLRALLATREAERDTLVARSEQDALKLKIADRLGIEIMPELDCYSVDAATKKLLRDDKEALSFVAKLATDEFGDPQELGERYVRMVEQFKSKKKSGQAETPEKPEKSPVLLNKKS